MYLEDKKKTHRAIVLSAVLLIALWFRYPFIGAGLPYFYDEDEAHHFNRVVNMVKKGEYNPHYFLKPSLHFYLRMPLVALGFLHEVKKGRARELADLDTEDPYGIGKYGFSASHPPIVKLNRLFSLALGLGGVLITALLTIELTSSLLIGALASLLVATAPALIPSATNIGVDPLACFFAMLAVHLAVRAVKENSNILLTATAIVSGLTLSSKYNAAPILVVPLTACLFIKRADIKSFTIALLVPILTFLATSPFILISLPLFLNHVAYEIWHYGIAGHEGHTEEPGIQQAIFYLRWLSTDGFGTIPVCLALAGALYTSIHHRRLFIIIIIFPALYFFLMSQQRANFTRNMHVVIPFLAILAAISLEMLRRGPKWITPLLACVIVIPTTLRGFEARNLSSIKESRITADSFIQTRIAEGGDVALEGELQFEPNLLKSERVAAVSKKDIDPVELYLRGFSEVVVSRETAEKLSFLPVLRSYGERPLSRIVRDPEIKIMALEGPSLESLAIQKALPGGPPIKTYGKYDLCTTEEGHCWLSSRELFLPVEMTSEAILLVGEFMSPWRGQKVNGVEIVEAGKWQRLAIPVEILEGRGRLSIKEIHQVLGDGRRLGVAAKNLTVVEREK